MEKVIGLGDIVISNNKQDILKTYALGSCIGITVYSSRRRAGGMGHIVLPRTIDLHNASEKPGYYALTGVPFLIKKICTEYRCSISELEVSLFGGANSIREKDSFQIGKRNAEEVLKMLKILNIKPVSTEIGGYSSRTIEMDILSGNVKITKQPIRF